jgi:hypothetical protein
MAEKIAASNWSEEEFGSIDFGDKRLNRRVIKLAGQLSEQPQAFINTCFCERDNSALKWYGSFINSQF